MAKLIESGGNGPFEATGEINVTPLIDVMLVLLLVFMIAAPISTVNVPLELPSSSARVTPPTDKPVTISIARDLKIHVGDDIVALAVLGGALRAAGAIPATTVFLRIDKRVAYGDTIAVLDTLRTAGYTKISLVGIGGGG